MYDAVKRDAHKADALLKHRDHEYERSTLSNRDLLGGLLGLPLGGGLRKDSSLWLGGAVTDDILHSS